MQRFLQRVWRNFVDQNRNIKLGQGIEPDIEKKLHQTIQKVTNHIEGLRFNTAIAALIELNNELVGLEEIPEEVARPFLKLLAPLAPHIAEEIWSLGAFDDEQLGYQPWPKSDESKMVEDTVILPIQVNGKIRGQVEVPMSMGEEEIKIRALAVESVKKHVMAEEEIKRFILIPGKIVNIVQ